MSIELQRDGSDTLSPPKVVFACVTEPTKKFLDQAARLVMSLRWFGGKVADARFVVGCTNPLPVKAKDLFRHFQAEMTRVERYDKSHGPSNKISLLNSPALEGADVVVLLDCDTIMVQDPSGWLTVAGMAAKLADLPTVSLSEMAGIFHHFEIDGPEPKYTIELTGDPTIAYCNSGVVILREEWREMLAQEWDRWNRILLNGPEQMEFNRYHTDQVSLALAIETTGIPFEPLPSEMNMATHLPPESYPPEWHFRDPVIIHYHWLAYPDGFLQPCLLQRCGRRIDSFNAKLRAEALTFAPSSHLRSNKPPPSNQDDPKVIVGSGWWCDESSHEWAIGSDATRTVAFFDVWYRQVIRTLNPHRIVVTDSASPVKPDHRSYGPIEWIELDRNYGHPNDLRVGHVQTKYSGFTRSVINGAMYALCCEADFYVYVEQDCLLHGEEFLRQAIGDSKESFLLGPATEGGKGLHGSVAVPMLQQSLMIVRRDGLERFLEGLLGAPWTDGEKSPEEIMRLRLSPYGFVNVPYGRSRPIDFTQSHFYAQHLDDEELHEFLKLEHVQFPDAEFAFSTKPDNE